MIGVFGLGSSLSSSVEELVEDPDSVLSKIIRVLSITGKGGLKAAYGKA